MAFAPIDYTILFVYLISAVLLGIWFGRKQKDTVDYFLGSRSLPWPAVCFSVVATETSTLTFISIPGLAYLTNMNFLQITFGYLIGRIIISFIFLPAYYRGELSTAYEFLGGRFGGNLRGYASVIFQITRLLADGVRLFATAIPLSVITGWSYPVSIIVIALFTIVYTYIGGIRAVVWMDVIQMIIYVGGAIIAGIFLLHKIPGGWEHVVAVADMKNKFQIIYLGFDKPLSEFFRINYTLFSGIIGGAFLSMASHGTDQLIVQRLLTCNNLRSSQKALITSGVIVIFQFALFLLLGLLLYVYYQGEPMRADAIFPRFIVEGLPPGLSGIIIAGVFAAAMSTLSGSLNSLASSTMLDIYKPRWGKANSPKKDLLISRFITFVWGIIFIGGAMIFKDKENPVVELGLAIASFTYGGLLGVFFLGNLNKMVKENDALIAMWSAIFFMTWIISPTVWVMLGMFALNLLAGVWIYIKLKDSPKKHFISFWFVAMALMAIFVQAPQIAWPWYVFIGSIVTYVIATVLEISGRGRDRRRDL